MKKMFLSAAVIAALAMSACGTGKQAPAADLSGEWNIVEVNGQKTVAGEQPYIGLDMATKRLHGNAGCNRMMGSFELDSINPEKIRFTQVATTRMMCPDMDMEQKVLAALNEVAGYAGTESGVVLTDAEGKVVIALEKREQPAASINDLEGEWIIAEVEGTAIGKQDKTPFLAFDVAGQRVHGNAGCNIINGGFSQEEGKAASLRFTQMLSTMMACPDMDTERQVLQALDKVRGFALGEGGALTLLDENGTVVLTLTKNNGKALSE